MDLKVLCHNSFVMDNTVLVLFRSTKRLNIINVESVDSLPSEGPSPLLYSVHHVLGSRPSLSPAVTATTDNRVFGVVVNDVATLASQDDVVVSFYRRHNSFVVNLIEALIGQHAVDSVLVAVNDTFCNDGA